MAEHKKLSDALHAECYAGFRLASAADLPREIPPIKRKPHVIVIEGPIAAGKSTLVALLAERLNALGLKAVAVPEPVEEWQKVGILERFYKDPVGVAYTFQTLTFVTRIMAAIRVAEQNPNADVFVVERSVLADRHVFMHLQADAVGKQTMDMYDLWFTTHIRLMPWPLSEATFVYLRPGVEQCMARTHARGRVEEAAGVTSAYQAALVQRHDALLLNAGAGVHPRPFPVENVVVLEGALADCNFSAPGPERERVLEHLLRQLGYLA